MTTVSQEAREAEVTVREIETVTGDFLTEAGEPFYRIEINGYCADFDHRQAAENFVAAIQRAFEDQTRKLREQLARYEGGAGPDDWRECPGQCGESCCGYHDVCRQALKETPRCSVKRWIR